MSNRNYNFNYSRISMKEPTELYSDYNIWTPHATQQFALGTILDLDDGRRFRYAKNGSGAALTAAYMNAQPAATAHWFEQVQTNTTVPSAGDYEVKVMEGGTAPAKDAWAEGWLLVNKGTGLGQMLKIKSNPASTDPTIVLAEPVKTAWAATSEISIIVNPWNGVVVAPTTVEGIPVGVNLAAVTESYYFWAQTKGPAPIIVDAGDTVVIGEPAGKPGTNGTAGGVGVVGNDGTDAVYGFVMHVGEAGEPAIIWLTLE